MKPRQVRDAVHALRDELVDLARDLVRIPSVTGSEDEAQEALAERLRDWGLEVDLFRIDESVTAHPAYCDDGLPVSRLNLVARFGDGAPTDRAALVLNGHIDVVPEGSLERWRIAPYEGDVSSGALHGRGSCDMKSGLAASAIAIRAATKLGLAPRRPIQLWSVVGEETGGLGTLAAIERGYRGDAAILAEPTSLELCPVQAGALSFRLAVHGQAAHGALRAEGVSAVEKFTPVLEALRRLEERRHESFRHPAYAEGALVAPLSVGKVSAGNWPSTVPEELVAEGRFGVFPGEDCEAARRSFERAVAEVSASDEWLREHPVSVSWFEGQFEPGETDSDAVVLGTLGRCHREVLGGEPAVHGVSYGSDLRLFTRYAGMPAVLYGPGDVRVAHAANESVPLDEMLHAAEVLALVVARSV